MDLFFHPYPTNLLIVFNLSGRYIKLPLPSPPINTYSVPLSASKPSRSSASPNPPLADHSQPCTQQPPSQPPPHSAPHGDRTQKPPTPSPHPEHKTSPPPMHPTKAFFPAAFPGASSPSPVAVTIHSFHPPHRSASPARIAQTTSS